MLLTITALAAQQALALVVKELWHRHVQVASLIASMPKRMLPIGTNSHSLSLCSGKLSEQLGRLGNKFRCLTVWLKA